MARRGNGSGFLKWSLIGSGIAAGAMMIPLIPALKKRAMRVTTILKKDHRMVSGLIAALEMTPKSGGTARKKLFEQIRNSALVHAQAEEEVLYPAVRNLFVGDTSIVDESYREHQTVKDLLNDLLTMDPSTEAFDSKFAQFKNNLEHHVDEEENDMFVTIMQRMSFEQQEALGKRIHDRKMDLKTKRAA
jgi:hemerythrin superfamily protein